MKINYKQIQDQDQDPIPIGLIFNRAPEKDKDFIEEIKNYMSKNFKEITSSQLRNIFSEIKSIKYNEETRTKIQMLRVKFAYIRGRSDKHAMKVLCGFLDKLVEKIEKQKDWESFVSFFEALIAYHKFYGGK